MDSNNKNKIKQCIMSARRLNAFEPQCMHKQQAAIRLPRLAEVLLLTVCQDIAQTRVTLTCIFAIGATSLFSSFSSGQVSSHLEGDLLPSPRIQIAVLRAQFCFNAGNLFLA